MMTIRNGSELSIEAKIDSELTTLSLPGTPSKYPSFSGHLFVSGLPIIPKEKYEKFKLYLLNNLQVNAIVIDDIKLPLSEKNQTKGIAFIKFKTHEMAKEAVLMFNGRMIDKSHSYQMILLDDYEKLIAMNENYKEPPKNEFKYKDNMLSWLLNEQCRDQVMINARNNNIIIYEMSPNNLTQIISRESFTEINSFWSSNGTYLASIHEKGVALWGGPIFEQFNKYTHKGVQHLLFSPKEKYMVTFSLINDMFRVLVWEVLLENELREFIIPNEDRQSKVWPQIRWSFDDSYFAIQMKDKISVYKSSSCQLIDKKSLEIPGLKDFKWANNRLLISYWVPECSNSPARVVIVEIPSRKEIFVKNLFNVSDINLHWSTQDEFLGVIGERYSRKKVTSDGTKYVGVTVNIEIFRILEKEIPVEKIDAKDRRQVLHYQWEPNGTRFAMICANQNNYFLMIYDLKTNDQITEIKNYAFTSNVRMNMIRWSPKGQYLVCAAARTGNIEFYDGTDGTFFYKADHPNLMDVSWDPTGRYVTSYSLSLVNETTECVVNFWSSIGKSLQSRNFQGLKQFIWRPRPPCMLPESKIKDIKKNMSKYSQKFIVEDELMSNEFKRIQIETRRSLMSEWTKIKKQISEKFNEQKIIRLEKRKNKDTDILEAGHEKEDIYVLVNRKKEPVAL